MQPVDSSVQFEHIAERLARVQLSVEEACLRSGRSRSEISIVAVTKTFPVEFARKACAAGAVHLGENRIQEAIEKYGDGWLPRDYPDVTLHLIGHLQRNKVRKAVQIFPTIDSVDSLEIAQAIDREADIQQKIARILIEVNTSGEPQKYGVQPDEVVGLVSSVIRLPKLSIAGLMTVGPNVEDQQSIRNSFRLLKSLFERVRQELSPSQWSVLSMGMSHDYVTAIEEGATEIRLGTAIFGERS
jgi:PLP dependent protein